MNQKNVIPFPFSGIPHPLARALIHYLDKNGGEAFGTSTKLMNEVCLAWDELGLNPGAKPQTMISFSQQLRAIMPLLESKGYLFVEWRTAKARYKRIFAPEERNRLSPHRANLYLVKSDKHDLDELRKLHHEWKNGKELSYHEAKRLNYYLENHRFLKEESSLWQRFLRGLKALFGGLLVKKA